MIRYRDVEPKARGRWLEIMDSFGIHIPRFRGKNSENGPCPLCGGDDRAHWRAANGRIALFCRSCAADSMKSPESVLMEKFNWSFPQFVSEVFRFLHLYPEDYQILTSRMMSEPNDTMPKDHRQDFSKCKAFLDSAIYKSRPFVDGYLYPGELPVLNGTKCLPITNERGAVINIAALHSDSISYLAGGISYNAWHEIPGNERVVYFLDISDALKFHHAHGVTARALLDMRVVFYMHTKYGVDMVLPDWANELLNGEVEILW